MYLTESISLIATTTTKSPPCFSLYNGDSSATPCCDRTLPLPLPLLTDPEVYSKKLVGHKFYVELVSKEWELQDDYAVPKRWQRIDVVVAEPTVVAVKQLIAATGWLKDWRILDYWQADEQSPDYCPF